MSKCLRGRVEDLVAKDLDDSYNRKFKIRISVLNMHIDGWRSLEKLYGKELKELRTSPKEFLSKIGQASFLTALINKEERDFSDLFYELIRLVGR